MGNMDQVDKNCNLSYHWLGPAFFVYCHPYLGRKDGLRACFNIVQRLSPSSFSFFDNNRFYPSCFITSEDNNAWSLTFFFIPVGISLVLGSVLFMICLIRLLVVAIRLRKIAEVVVPYTRVIIFIFIFFLVISLFVAYVINNAANESTITSGYELYYECISGTTFTPPSQCALDSNVSSYPLVMLKGFAASCLGFLLFFNFMSWTVLKHWGNIFVGIFEVLRKRNKKALEHLFSIVGGESITASSGLSASISVGGATAMAEEDDKIERGQERDEEDEESKEESGSEEVASSSKSDTEN